MVDGIEDKKVEISIKEIQEIIIAATTITPYPILNEMYGKVISPVKINKLFVDFFNEKLAKKE